MFINLNDVESDHFFDKKFDVAICGAGVAGITLARKLSQHFSVALCEAGGLQFSAESQEQYRGQISGAEYFPLDVTRLRFFGGASNHWTGWCRPLDAHDFEPKGHNLSSGWPIKKADLDPHVEETRDILDLSDDVLDSCPADEQHDLDGFERIQFSWSPPTRFNKKYREEINQSSRISCYLNANVIDLQLAENSQRITRMDVSDYADRIFSVRAQIYIVAAGGLENARLLLNCDKQRTNGIGNEYDLVGRFFSEHMHYIVGRFIFEDGQKELFSKPKRSRYSCFYGPRYELLQTEQILNFGLRIRIYQENRDSGFKHKLREILCYADWPQNIVNRFRDRDVDCSVFGDGEIKFAAEQGLNKQSRVILNDEVDRFGLRRITLHWQRSAVDKRTLQRGAIRFAEEFARKNIGRLQIADWLLSEDTEFPGLSAEETGGHHHMCTTRMASRPQDGVVNSDQNVFGTGNLYVTGSSVFSTGGQANPTFTIVQLALRLADHLATTVSPQN